MEKKKRNKVVVSSLIAGAVAVPAVVQVGAAENTAPVYDDTHDHKELERGKKEVFSLNDLFTDDDGDDLTYEVSVESGEEVVGNVGIDGDKITVTPLEKGSFELSVIVDDGQEKVTKVVPFDVVDEFYKKKEMSDIAELEGKEIRSLVNYATKVSDASVKIESSDREVAEVNLNGDEIEVVKVSEGIAVVTVDITYNNETLSYDFKVNTGVLEPKKEEEKVKVETSKDTYSVDVGEYFNLSSTSTVTASSSNKEVFTTEVSGSDVILNWEDEGLGDLEIRVEDGDKEGYVTIPVEYVRTGFTRDFSDIKAKYLDEISPINLNEYVDFEDPTFEVYVSEEAKDIVGADTYKNENTGDYELGIYPIDKGVGTVTVETKTPDGEIISQDFEVEFINGPFELQGEYPEDITLQPGKEPFTFYLDDYVEDGVEYEVVVDEGTAGDYVELNREGNEVKVIPTDAGSGRFRIDYTEKVELDDGSVEEGGLMNLQTIVTVKDSLETTRSFNNRVLGKEDENTTVDLSNYFTSTEGNELTYSVRAVDEGIVDIERDGNNAIFTAGTSGSTVIEVTAEDEEKGYTESQTFLLEVEDRTSVEVEGFDTILEKVTDSVTFTGSVDGLQDVYNVEVGIGNARKTVEVGEDGAFEAEMTGEEIGKGTFNELLVKVWNEGKTKVLAEKNVEGMVEVKESLLDVKPEVGEVDGLIGNKGDTVEVDVSEIFTDETSALTYEVVAQDSGIVSLAQEGSLVQVALNKQGETSLNVTARNEHGNKEQAVIPVVIENRVPEITSSFESEYSFGESGTIVMEGTVADPDNEEVEVSLSIGGVEKTATVNTGYEESFTISFDREEFDSDATGLVYTLSDGIAEVEGVETDVTVDVGEDMGEGSTGSDDTVDEDEGGLQGAEEEEDVDDVGDEEDDGDSEEEVEEDPGKTDADIRRERLNRLNQLNGESAERVGSGELKDYKVQTFTEEKWTDEESRDVKVMYADGDYVSPGYDMSMITVNKTTNEVVNERVIDLGKTFNGKETVDIDVGAEDPGVYEVSFSITKGDTLIREWMEEFTIVETGVDSEVDKNEEEEEEDVVEEGVDEGDDGSFTDEYTGDDEVEVSDGDEKQESGMKGWMYLLAILGAGGVIVGGSFLLMSNSNKGAKEVFEDKEEE